MLMKKIHFELIEEVFEKRKKNTQDFDLKDIHEDCKKIENE